MFVIKFKWLKGEDHLKELLEIHSKHHVHLGAMKARDTEITAAQYTATSCSDSGVTLGFRCATIRK